MSFQLKPKKYNWKHFIIIPFQCAPVCTVVIMIQKLLTALSNVFQVIAIADFIDKALNAAQGKIEIEKVIPSFVIMMLLIGWKRVSFNLGRIFMRKVEILANDQMTDEITKKMSRLHYSLIEDSSTWELFNRVFTKIERHIFEMLQRTCNLALYFIRILGVFIILFTQVWWLGLVVGLLTIPLMFLSLHGGKKIYSKDKEAGVYNRRHKYLLEILTNREAADERNLFGYSDSVTKEWYNQYEQGRKINLKAELSWVISVNGGSAVISLISTVIVIIMVPLVAYGQIKLGMFIALATAVYDFVNLMGFELTRATSQLARYNEYMKDLTQLANLKEANGANDIPTKIPQVFESMEFIDVSFQYPGSEVSILNHFNMKLENGKHYAFVGENGAGKTTIIKLITGLYDNYEGTIRLNGKDLREYDPSDLKAMYSSVYQDFARYYISIQDNIMLGDVNHMDTEDAKRRMEDIAKQLDMIERIKSLSKGFGTKIGKLDNESVDFSGGEWQRIAMARALMNPAPIQILDEPTAALDPISESKLYEQFDKISKDRATIFISHRLGSTKLADYIYVFKDGVVKEQGSHNQLMQESTLYAEMYNSQKGWYQDAAIEGI